MLTFNGDFHSRLKYLVNLLPVAYVLLSTFTMEHLPPGPTTIDAIFSEINEALQGSTPEETNSNTHQHAFGIHNYVLHYFGPLRYAERDDFFKETNPHWGEQLQLRGALGDKTHVEAKDAINAYRQSWENSCLHELETVASLREKLAGDPEGKHLVEQLNRSRAECLSFLHVIGRRRGLVLAASTAEDESGRPDRSTENLYNAETHIDASVLFLQETGIGYRGTNLTMNVVVRGVFPNQTTTLEELFNHGFDWLMAERFVHGSQRSEGGIKYLHLPHNNMDWAEGITEYRDRAVIKRYVMSETLLHPRRTLEQGYHWTMNEGEDYSKDQVMYRATKARAFHLYDPKTQTWPDHQLSQAGDCDKCRDDSRKVASIVMVDQLWMWILNSNTIITCFPDQYGSQRHESLGVDRNIRARMEISNSQLGSVFDLGLIIIDECSNAIFDRTKASGGQPELVDVFSAAIGNIRIRQQSLFRKFWRWATEIEDTIQANGNSADIIVPLDLFTEGMLIRELKDIIEELDIMVYTVRTQREVLRTFIGNAERILDPLNEFRSSNQRAFLSSQRRKDAANCNEDQAGYKDDNQRVVQEDKFFRFRGHADQSSTKLLSRIENLEELREAANAGVESLKGQQASLIQAWRSTSQSEESVSQGRVILVFTLVTIVFLPLSFMSSVFGMNNAEFGSGTWEVRTQVVYMVAVAVSVIVYGF
ncbi:hypothetical protein PG984_011503 [Apiospora sp. TS-2023a]